MLNPRPERTGLAGLCRRGTHLLQSPRGEGGREDTPDPPPLVVLCDRHGVVERPVHTEVLQDTQC